MQHMGGPQVRRYLLRVHGMRQGLDTEMDQKLHTSSQYKNTNAIQHITAILPMS